MLHCMSCSSTESCHFASLLSHPWFPSGAYLRPRNSAGCFILNNWPDALCCSCVWLPGRRICSVQLDATAARLCKNIDSSRILREAELRAGSGTLVRRAAAQLVQTWALTRTSTISSGDRIAAIMRPWRSPWDLGVTLHTAPPHSLTSSAARLRETQHCYYFNQSVNHSIQGCYVWRIAIRHMCYTKKHSACVWVMN